MRIAFYAPLKPPTHPVPSGDRAIARLLTRALRRGGHAVTLASRLRSRDGAGDPARQQRIAATASRLAERYLARIARRPGAAPQLWFTYHPYYKAPDWLGPRIADALAIPYVVAEVSLAGKRAAGPWEAGHAATVAAVKRADAVIGLNAVDRAGVAAALGDPGRWHALPPFIDTTPFAAAAAERERHRRVMADRHGLDPAKVWIAVVAMMRPGDKLASYRLLAAAAARLAPNGWQLVIAGDGAARAEVAAAFAAARVRPTFIGGLAPAAVPAFLAAADLYAWPAVNEAFGMALIEAQACGVPVVAGATGGVPDVVDAGATGLLSAPGDVAAFAEDLRRLVVDGGLRARLGAAALRRARTRHDLVAASRRLDAILRPLVGARAA